jgi:hypothetical protein
VGEAWQFYVETAFSIQRRMVDWHFASTSNWPEIVVLHERFVERYNF